MQGFRPLRNPRFVFLDAAERTIWNRFCDDPKEARNKGKVGSLHITEGVYQKVRSEYNNRVLLQGR